METHGANEVNDHAHCITLIEPQQKREVNMISWLNSNRCTKTSM